MKLATNLSAVFATITIPTETLLGAADQLSGDKSSNDASWSELVTSIEKMHMAMEAVKQSDDNDIDFVRLMVCDLNDYRIASEDVGAPSSLGVSPEELHLTLFPQGKSRAWVRSKNLEVL